MSLFRKILKGEVKDIELIKNEIADLKAQDLKLETDITNLNKSISASRLDLLSEDALAPAKIAGYESQVS